MSDLDRLLALAPPPSSPVENDWAAVEAELGFRPPGDFVALADRYGYGWFAQGLRATTAGPGGLQMVDDVRSEGDFLSANKASAGARWRLQEATRPEPGGLVLWGRMGRDSGVRGAYWLWEGDGPDSWPVVLVSDGLRPTSWRFPGTATALICDYLEGALAAPFAKRPATDAQPFREMELEHVPEGWTPPKAPKRRRGLFGR